MLEKPIGSGQAHRIGVIFSEMLVHADMADAVLKTVGMQDAKVVSAGFYDLHKRATYGGSTSLMIGSRPMDAVWMAYPQMQSVCVPTEPEPLTKEHAAGLVPLQICKPSDSKAYGKPLVGLQDASQVASELAAKVSGPNVLKSYQVK